MLAQIFKLLASLLLPLAVGGVAARFTASAIPGWYAQLNKPAFNPPNALFAPVWTSLYLLMGIAFYLVWRQPPSPARQRAMGWYFLQLALNFAWSFLFFYYKQMGWALVEIIVMLAAIGCMLYSFRRVNPVAAWLNLPYLLWVCFATALNAAYWWLNRC